MLVCDELQYMPCDLQRVKFLQDVDGQVKLVTKSPSAILGTKAGCFKYGSDCTDVGAEGGNAVLHSPTRPSKSFWMTMLGVELETF